MRRFLCFLFIVPTLAWADESVVPQPMPEITQGANNSMNLRWHGITGRSYFIEVSDDFEHWHFAPIIEAGNDEEIEHEIGSLKRRELVRLVYTDQTAADLDTADFDGDGLGNLAEITVFHSHPLKRDSDNDGLDDKWETDHGLDPTDDGSTNPDNGGYGDPDDDGSTNLAEHENKTKPDDNQDFAIQLVSVRRNATGGSTEYTGGASLSSILDFIDWANNLSTEQPDKRLTPSIVASRLEAFAEFPVSIPEKEDAPRLGVDTWGSTIFSTGGKISGHTDDGAKVNVTLDQAKVWLRAPAGSDPITVRMLKVTEQLSTPWDINSNPNTNLTSSSYTGATVEKFTIPASAVDDFGAFTSPSRESNGVEVLPSLTFMPRSEERTVVSFRNINIVPAVNMAGVVGDMIPSNQTQDPQLHFVTPKKSPEIPDDYVIFEATGLQESEILPGAGQLVVWDGGDEVPGKPLQRRIKRDKVFSDPGQNGHSQVRLLTIPYHGSTEVAKINVWVVWATIKRPPSKYGFASFSQDQQTHRYNFSSHSDARIHFIFSISPEELFSSTIDRPKLEGPSTKDVPGEGKPHILHTSQSGDHADLKWDLSRQLSIRILNPNKILRSEFNGEPSSLFANQPATSGDPLPPNQPVLSFPDDPAEGNDDPDIIDEDSNPYRALGGELGLEHDLAEIHQSDRPTTPINISNSIPSGARFVDINNFREFVRLELWDGKREGGRYWFRVSEFENWHFTLDAIYSSFGTWSDNSSSQGAGHDNRN